MASWECRIVPGKGLPGILLRHTDEGGFELPELDLEAERLAARLVGRGCLYDDLLTTLSRTPLVHEPPGQLAALLDLEQAGSYAEWISELRRTLAAHSPITELRREAAWADCPDHVLVSLARDPDPEVRRNLCGRPRLRESVRSILVCDPDPEVRMRLALHPDLSAWQIDQLSQDADPRVRVGVCRSKSGLGIRTELRLARDRTVEVKVALAERPYHEATVAATLARDLAPEPAEVLASFCDHIDVLYVCIRHTDPRVRRAVARRSIRDRELQEQLAFDPDPEVRSALASNPNLHEKVMEVLARDPKSAVRAILLSQPRLPVEAQLILVREGSMNLLVQIAASPHLESKTYSICQARGDPSVRQELARNPAVPASVLQRLAQDPEREVRLVLAEYPRLPTDIIVSLAYDDDPEVRARVLERPDLALDLLNELAESGWPEVREHAQAVQALRREGCELP